MMVLLIAQQTVDLWSRLREGGVLMVVGMLVVFSALCLTAGAIAVLNRLLGQEQILDRQQQPSSASASPLGESAEQDARLRVVLAAAAAVVVGQAVRVDRIAPVKG